MDVDVTEQLLDILSPSLSFSLSLSLSAGSQPEIIDAPTDMIAVEGERVDFKLKVLGFPPPSVLWYHNGCMVGPDYATEVSDDGGITLVSVEPNHQGTVHRRLHEQSLQEMLRKARQQQQHNRKAKQHNTTRLKLSFFKENWLPRCCMSVSHVYLCTCT